MELRSKTLGVFAHLGHSFGHSFGARAVTKLGGSLPPKGAMSEQAGRVQGVPARGRGSQLHGLWGAFQHQAVWDSVKEGFCLLPPAGGLRCPLSFHLLPSASWREGAGHPGSSVFSADCYCLREARAWLPQCICSSGILLTFLVPLSAPPAGAADHPPAHTCTAAASAGVQQQHQLWHSLQPKTCAAAGLWGSSQCVARVFAIRAGMCL